MTCTACEPEERICRETFTCSECGQRKNVCRYRVGETDVCSECWERRELGPEWVRYWARKGIDPEAMRRRDMRKISRRVQAWRAGETLGESDPELLLRQMQMLLDSGDAARLRRAGGLSLRETADLVGVTKNAVHKWERKVSKPDGERAMRYARLLDDLLCGGT